MPKWNSVGSPWNLNMEWKNLKSSLEGLEFYPGNEIEDSEQETGWEGEI